MTLEVSVVLLMLIDDEDDKNVKKLRGRCIIFCPFLNGYFETGNNT
jgi:hypothetical protein